MLPPMVSSAAPATIVSPSSATEDPSSSFAARLPFEAIIHMVGDKLREVFDSGDVNILWWDDRLWFIDFPQASDIAHNPHALDFLHRDLHNICAWFNRKGVGCDPEALFAELLAVTF